MSSSGVCNTITSARNKEDGYGSLENPEKFLHQDFEWMQKMKIDTDSEFPANRDSIGDKVLHPNDMARVQWKRPGELVSNPKFILDNASRFDFGQGFIGNCWFLASIGALTFEKSIMAQVVPLEQTFDGEYCGLFHFRFWRFGNWVDVVIDDRLPTLNNRLIFVQSKDTSEFWPSLLEKAYAKVCGSYSDMNGGTTAEALVDFTGSVHMCVQLKTPPSELWDMMIRAAQTPSLMGCGTPQGATSENTVLPNGIVEGHAYAVTAAREEMSRGRQVRLVRLWNPWGKGEWNGDWSDNSSLWNTVSREVRDSCLLKREDGEFWMTLEDFCRYYDDLDICCLCPDFLDGNSSCHWTTVCYNGQWVPGTTAGGCMNYPDSYAMNPQYRVKVDSLSEDCIEDPDKKNMLVSLMQKQEKRNRNEEEKLHVGFSVYEVTDKYQGRSGKLPSSFFRQSRPVAQTKSFINAREVVEFFTVKPGEYVIVPCTFYPNETASFFLTILTKAETHIHEEGPSGHDHEMEEETNDHRDEEDNHDHDHDNDDKIKDDFRDNADKYAEVDATMLQKLLNEVLLKGDLQNGGFTLDMCHSMIALMDTSTSGKLNQQEFKKLWNKIMKYKDMFKRIDKSNNGVLSMNELIDALMSSGKWMSMNMMNLMSMRYGNSGKITLETFVYMALRMEGSNGMFNELSSGGTITLNESEWMYISMSF